MAALSRRRWLAILLLGLVAFESRAAPPDPRWPAEYAVKAAFLYHFARFVKWPEVARASRQPFVLVILGQDPFGQVVDETLGGSIVKERKVVIRRVHRVDDSLDADMVFVSPSEDQRLDVILRRLAGRSILTVGESQRFAERGGMINLRMIQNRVTFDINPSAATEAGLTISSQVLKLARIVGRAS